MVFRDLVTTVPATQLLSSTYGLFLAHKKYAVTVVWVSSLGIGVAALSSALLVYIFIAFAPIPILKLRRIHLCGFLSSLRPLLKVISKEDVRNLDELSKELTPIYPIAKRILNLEEKILALNITL